MRQSKLFRSACAAVAVAALGVTGAACGNAAEESGGSGESGAVKIGAALDLTGYLASFDRGVRAGVDLAVDKLRKDGREVEVSYEDMKGDPQGGVRATQRLADRDGARAFVNGFSSGATSAIAPIAEQRKLPMIVASVIPEDAAWEFSTLPAPQFETGVRLEWLAKQGAKRIAVLRDPTPYNEAQEKALREQVKEMGMTIVGVAQHEPDAVDLRAQVTSLLRDHPDALVKLSAGPTHIVAAKALSSAGSDIPLLLGIEAMDTIRKASAEYDQTYFAAAPPQVYTALKPDERSPALEALVEAAPKDQDLTYVGRGYDAMLILAEAIDRAGSTEGEAVRKAIEDLEPFEGTSATYDFTAQSHYGITENPLFLGRVQGDADPEIVFRPSGA
jgi:branched-chain amino acid transport system substrate-binding protein